MNNIGAICLATPTPGSGRALLDDARRIYGCEDLHWCDDQVALIETPVWAASSAHRARSGALVSNAAPHDPVVCVDARLDYRAELIAALGVSPATSGTDADLVARAYEKWKENCFAHLAGDFSVLVWEGATRTLVAARDPLGVRSLFYAILRDRVVVSSTLAAVRAALQSAEVNRTFVAEYLSGNLRRWQRETAFSGIFRVPPGHALIYASGRPSLARYYYPPPVDVPAVDRDVVDRFRQLFRRSVEERLRGPAPIAILLSGGVDSSSVACEANQLLAPSGGRLRSYSSIFDATPHADEREYLQAVLQQCPTIAPTFIKGDGCWAFREMGDDCGFPADEPENGLIRSLFRSRIAAGLADGCRIFLGGYGADQVLLPGGYLRPSTLRDLEPVDQLREFRYYLDRHSVIGVLARAYLPSRLKSLAGRPLAAEEPTVFGPARGTSARLLATSLGGGAESARLSQFDTLARTWKFEWRHPFYDRRVVEFVLSLPPIWRFRRGVRKYVLKEAMRGVLPESVRTRTYKPNANALWHRGLERERERLEALLRSPRAVHAGYVEKETLSILHAQWSRGLNPQQFSAFSRIVFLERWLRANQL